MGIFSELASVLMFVGMVGIANHYQPISFPQYDTSVYLFCFGLLSYGAGRIFE